jgi:hypothetical protein
MYIQYDGARRIYDRILVELEVALTNAGVISPGYTGAASTTYTTGSSAGAASGASGATASTATTIGNGTTAASTAGASTSTPTVSNSTTTASAGASGASNSTARRTLLELDQDHFGASDVPLWSAAAALQVRKRRLGMADDGRPMYEPDELRRILGARQLTDVVSNLDIDVDTPSDIGASARTLSGETEDDFESANSQNGGYQTMDLSTLEEIVPAFGRALQTTSAGSNGTNANATAGGLVLGAGGSAPAVGSAVTITITTTPGIPGVIIPCLGNHPGCLASQGMDSPAAWGSDDALVMKYKFHDNNFTARVDTSQVAHPNATQNGLMQSDLT